VARFGGTLPERAFRWSPHTGMVDLGALGPTASSVAFGINDAGTAVGWSDEASGPRLTQVTKWPAGGGGPIALNGFPSIASLAEDINNAGQIVGSAAFDTRLSDTRPSSGRRKAACRDWAPSQPSFPGLAASTKKDW